MSTLQLLSSRSKRAPSIDTLLSMLQVKRPHGSVSEAAFIRHFLEPLGLKRDEFGNLWISLGYDPAILWSCHTDTCHRTPGVQDIICTEGLVRVADSKQSNCLGADDAAGIWIMSEMIRARIPGLYVFHRGEERGGLGSSYFADHSAKLLSGMKAAIAFDRRGCHSIITHQRSGRSCSEAFANSLADALALDHQPDPTGTFTDTANYVHLIGECTNVSVGYDNEHTPNETLDLDYVARLCKTMLSANLSTLIFSREPGEQETLPDYGSHAMADDPQHWSPRLRSIYHLVCQYPEAVTDFLELSGVTAHDLGDYIGINVPF